MMTKEQFTALPYLLAPGQVASCGYAPATLNKYAENGILVVVLPAGVAQKRFQKRQVAQLLGWEDALDLTRWKREKPLLSFNAVHQWTGYDERTIQHITTAGGLVAVNPGGIGIAKYRKEQIGAWLGL